MVKYDKNHSLWQSAIFIKYVVTFLVVMFITISVIVSMFVYYRAKQKEATLSEVDRTMQNAIERMGNTIDSYMNMSTFAIVRESGGFDTSYLRFLKSINISERDRFEYYANFASLASTMHLLNRNVYAAYSFNQNGDSIMWNYNARNELKFPDITNWRGNADSERGAPLLLEPFSSTGDSNDEALLGIVRAIVDAPSVDIIGYFAITFKFDELVVPCKQMQLYNDQNIYILNAQNEVLSSIQRSEYDPILSKIIGEHVNDGGIQNDMMPATVDSGTSSVFAYSRIPGTEWTLFTSIPTNSIWFELNRFMFLSLTLTILLLTILFMVVFFVFFVSLARPIDNLISIIIDSGFFSDLRTSSDEIKFLSSSFTMFADIIQNLKIEHYIQQKRLKLEFLQLQINPHFLYGTLETIRMTAEIENDPVIPNMVTLLSQILRYSIATENIIATVRCELRILDNYIQLQQMRHDNAINVCFDIEPACYDVYIPKLTLQPLAENAVTHGLYGQKQINILIKGRCVDNRVELLVSDDGKGISAEKLRKLRLSLSLENKTSAHIGLWNVNHRVRLVYGDDYGINIESAPRVGTTIRVTLPKTQEGGH